MDTISLYSLSSFVYTSLNSPGEGCDVRGCTLVVGSISKNSWLEMSIPSL